MEIAEVKTKFSRLERLMTEYGQLKSLVRAMEHQRKNGIEFDPVYMDNVCKRLLDIEKLFDQILN